MAQEQRIYAYWKSLRRNREYRRGLAKGYNPPVLMEVARKFKRPIREIREVLDAQKQMP
jgi:hypothetical protein